MQGDKTTNLLYTTLRKRYGTTSPLANGYRSRAYFLRERAILHGLIDPSVSKVIDVGCGSGLMLRPLVGPDRLVFGLDYNADACEAALANGLPAIRGDAFILPFANSSIDLITNCQFFNQQKIEGVRTFVGEAARVLKFGGRLIAIWRNGEAAIHRFSHFCLSRFDGMRGLPVFPQYVHRLDDVRVYLRNVGLEVERAEVSLPILGWRSRNTTGLAARAIGASCIVVAIKR